MKGSLSCACSVAVEAQEQQSQQPSTPTIQSQSIQLDNRESEITCLVRATCSTSEFLANRT